ncbi:hypothetical protein EMIHUDRAFT_222192 [Emiliania huxleyi CCMP1516]|uniref:ShKT domain-containing protein n=4 Tax=Emiliania huxleyi TaxID=2903 RepID=A0A0D3KYK6_EMIH1|nr:hypothetical protein EMIHUDRAFT_222192 [Emiliania huxleyi CCMP1516]EOD40841.1 hypothetical protein EMIHUDRAFT_222192 [Emiliania huxleyi CCMP1516]|eukprot:XP_005793270.1 hypothetical protein EMIHUDRAFT_222192 [Emiliania huxleyi CCMP1516]
MRGGGGRPASECADSDKRCAEWAGVGECDKNPGFMRSQCQHSCGSCGWVNPHCAGHVAAAKQTGGIDAMFEAAAKRPELRATVHSRPPHGPWAWCQPGLSDACYRHPLIRRVHERVVNVTGVPAENAEFYQNAAANSLMGVRLFTFFIYLRAPEGGGGTRFPKLNITIEPALLWPNVKNGDLGASDMRTDHEALPPLAGLKYAANLWLHQFDFRGPNTHGCDLRELSVAGWRV